MRRDGLATLVGLAVLALALGAARRARADEVTIRVKDPLVRVRAEFDVFVNGAAAGIALVVLERGDALVLPADLERAGLQVRGGTRVVIDDRELVSLRSLAPGVRFEVDDGALALRITADPELLGRHVLDLRPTARPPDLEQRFDPSAYLDYAVDSDLAGHYGLTLEAGGRVGRWLATSTVTRPYVGRWYRGLTAAVRDDVPRLERLTLGDTFTGSGDLGGSVLLGGASLAREFSLDPYIVRAPLPTTTTILSSPSTMDVYVNGALVRQQALGPGYWDLTNLPASTGQSDVRAVIRDAFGRERTVDTRFYLASGLLAPGFTDYGVAAGALRRGYGVESFDYGPAAATGYYRFAMSDWFTPGFRAEASTELASAGASAAVGTRFGELDASVSASGAAAGPGAAARLSWQWLAPAWSTALRLTAESDRYANLSLAPAADRTLIDAEATAGVTLSRWVGLGAELHAGRYRDLGPYASAAGRAGLQLGGGAWFSLTLDYGKAAAGPVGLQVLALLTWGRAGYSADASVTRDRDGHSSEAISATKALPRDTGLGFRARATEDDQHAQTFDGALQGQTSFGRAEVEVARLSGMTTYHATASGAVVYIDRRLFLARPTDGSFALVETNVPGVGVTLENSLVGRTGRDGSLLVPDLQPYYGSKLAIRDRDVPVEYEPGRTSRYVAAPLRGGAIVAFDVRRISAIAGRLFVGLPLEEKRPSNGELSVVVDGELRVSPIADDGRFFLERMPPGKHVVQAVWGGGSCRAVVTLPERAPPIYDAGDVRCILDTLDPSGRVPSLRDPGYGVVPVEPETGAGSGAGSGGR